MTNEALEVTLVKETKYLETYTIIYRGIHGEISEAPAWVKKRKGDGKAWLECDFVTQPDDPNTPYLRGFFGRDPEDMLHMFRNMVDHLLDA